MSSLGWHTGGSSNDARSHPKCVMNDCHNLDEPPVYHENPALVAYILILMSHLQLGPGLIFIIKVRVAIFHWCFFFLSKHSLHLCLETVMQRRFSTLICPALSPRYPCTILFQSSRFVDQLLAESSPWHNSVQLHQIVGIYFKRSAFSCLLWISQ